MEQRGTVLASGLSVSSEKDAFTYVGKLFKLGRCLEQLPHRLSQNGILPRIAGEGISPLPPSEVNHPYASNLFFRAG
jgi:hypothetical protein